MSIAEETDAAMEALAELADEAIFVVIDQDDSNSFAYARIRDGSLSWVGAGWLLRNRSSFRRAEAEVLCEHMIKRFDDRLRVCSISEAIFFAKDKGWI